MFKNLRIKSSPEKLKIIPGSLTSGWLLEDSHAPITIEQINSLPDNIKLRIFRSLLPPDLLVRFNIDPITWKSYDIFLNVGIRADLQTRHLSLWAYKNNGQQDQFYRLEISDNPNNGIDLKQLQLNDPDSPRYPTDFDQNGQPTYSGSKNRNLAEEQRAMQNGLAPGQVRADLKGVSSSTLSQLEAFLATLGHRAYFFEPPTYASAWKFERSGFAYVTGHKLMDDINNEFQPGGNLHQSLDGSTPFRQSEQWRTVRGRAWAIHDGILEAIGESWENVRMVKHIGNFAGVDTFPNAEY